jgi:Ca-activated chloride channel homolog
MKILALILAITLFGPGDGKKKGRRGNALYEKEEYSDAARLYQEALSDVQAEGPGSLHSGLLNNLGAALFRQGDFGQAASAFAGSARMSASSGEMNRAMYNSGNAAFMQKQLEQALDSYRDALLSNPDNEDARFNYEFVKRQLDQQKQNDQKQDKQNKDKQKQDQKNQNEKNQQQDQNEQNQDKQEQDKQQQDKQDQDRQESNPDQLSREQAQRILQAMENDEQQLLRQIQKMKTRPRRVEKDW